MESRRSATFRPHRDGSYRDSEEELIPRRSMSSEAVQQQHSNLAVLHPRNNQDVVLDIAGLIDGLDAESDSEAKSSTDESSGSKAEQPSNAPGLTSQLVVAAPGKARNDFNFDREVEGFKGLRHASQSLAKAAEIMAHEVSREFLLGQYGADEATFNQFQLQSGSQFSPSASKGNHLADVNDHAGVLIVPVRNGDVTIAERVVVVTDTLPDGSERFCIKGYDNRIVPFKEFAAIVQELNKEGDHPPAAKDSLESRFRTRMRAASDASELLVRRNLKEANTPTLKPVFLRDANVSTSEEAKPFTPPPVKVRAEVWDNVEDAVPLGFGKSSPSPEADPLVDYQFHMDWNKIEGRILLFHNTHYEGVLKRPPKEGTGKSKRHPNVKVGGPVFAQIDGIAHVEVMGPAGKVHGVKMAHVSPLKLAELVKDAKGAPVVLRITTQDKAVHELTLSQQGAKMSLVNPQPRAGYSSSGAAFGVGSTVAADIDVYSYQGVDTGAQGTESGYANPQLLTSFGDRLQAGPFLRPAGSARGGFMGLGLSLANLVTLQPLRSSASRSTTFSLLATGIRLTAQGGLLAAFTTAANQARNTVTGTILGGSKAFSASGAGALSARVQAELQLTTTVVQETFTALLAFAAKRIPEGWKPERDPWKTLTESLGETVAEFMRLAANLGIQKGMNISRGNPVDWIAISVQSVCNTLLERLRQGKTGHEENHRWLQVMLDVLKYGVDLSARSIGNVGALDWAAFKEAVVTRSIVRADKLLAGAIAHVLDANGMIGEHASAYESQVAFATRHGNVLEWLYGVSDRLSVWAGEGEGALAQLLEQKMVVQTIIDCLEACKPSLNRVTLPALQEGTPLDKADKHAVDSIAYMLDPQVIKVNGFHKQIDALTSEQQGTFDKLRSGSVELGIFETTSLSEETRDEMVALQGTGQHLFGGPAYAVTVTYDGRTVKGDSKPGHAAPVRRDLTTFSEAAQRLAKPVHSVMLGCPGMVDVTKASTGLPERVILKIRKATRDYTVESQKFHYPLRYDYTGHQRLVPVVPGIRYGYNVMHSDAGEVIDPLEALYINLGATLAPKFPAVAYRAVVTDTRYIAEDAAAPRQQAPDRDPGKFRVPAQAVRVGDHVANTEILSSTTSQRLATAFGWSLGYGSSAKDRTQALVVRQETGINITHLTDLVQAEIIQPPGAVFRVVDVQPSGGIGQRVFLEQVDTYEWEQHAEVLGDRGGIWIDFDDAKLSLGLSGNETLFSRPTGTTESFIDASDRKARRSDSKGKEADVKQPKPQAPEKTADDRIAMGPGGHVYVHRRNAKTGEVTREFTSIKSYFVGNNIERPDSEDNTKPSTRLSRVMYPFTSDFAPRATKDAIHAAVLSAGEWNEEPIVRYLDDAIQNPHHRYYREKGGYNDSPLKAAHEEEVRIVKEVAAKLMEPIQSLKLKSVMDGEQTEWMAWLLTSMLRTPIALVQVETADDGTAHIAPDAQVRLFEETYDKVDISKKIDKSPNPPVLIGVGEHGFYVIESRDGQQVCRHMAYDQPTAETFLHAYYRASPYSGSEAYSGKDDLWPTRTARRTVDALLEKIRNFSAVDYIVLQSAICRAARRRAKIDDAALLGAKIDLQKLIDRGEFFPMPERAAKAHAVVAQLPSVKTSEQNLAMPTAPRPLVGQERRQRMTEQQLAAVGPMEQNFLGELADNSTKTAIVLFEAGLGVVENSGDQLNCLILSILQGVSGKEYGHETAARAVREAVLKSYPEVAGQMLYPDDEAAKQLISIIAAAYGLPDLSVHVYAPGEHGPLPFAIPEGDGQPCIPLLFGRHGAMHYELITTL